MEREEEYEDNEKVEEEEKNVTFNSIINVSKKNSCKPNWFKTLGQQYLNPLHKVVLMLVPLS